MAAAAVETIESSPYDESYWKERFWFYDLAHSTPLQSRAITLARTSCAERSFRMLDLGCGDGRSIYGYGSCGELGGSDVVVAFDLSGEGLSLTRGVFPEARPVMGSAVELPFCRGSFDFVFSSMLIEHIDDDAMLEEVHRILRGGGVFYLSTVIRRPWAPFQKIGPEGRPVLSRNHLREYGHIREIESLLSRHGFACLSSRSHVFMFPLVLHLLMAAMERGLLRIPLSVRTMRMNPLFREYARIWVLPVPIPGYHVFEGIFVPDGRKARHQLSDTD